MAFIPAYIAILFVTILIDYFAGIYIERVEGGQQKNPRLFVSIVSTCTVLAIFKYLDFLTGSFRRDWRACSDGMCHMHRREYHLADWAFVSIPFRA